MRYCPVGAAIVFACASAHAQTNMVLTELQNVGGETRISGYINFAIAGHDEQVLFKLVEELPGQPGTNAQTLASAVLDSPTGNCTSFAWTIPTQVPYPPGGTTVYVSVTTYQPGGPVPGGPVHWGVSQVGLNFSVANGLTTPTGATGGGDHVTQIFQPTATTIAVGPSGLNATTNELTFVDSNTDAMFWMVTVNGNAEPTVPSSPHQLVGTTLVPNNNYTVHIQGLDSAMNPTGAAFNEQRTAVGNPGSAAYSNVQFNENETFAFDCTGSGIASFDVTVDSLTQNYSAPAALASRTVGRPFGIVADSTEIPAAVMARVVIDPALFLGQAPSAAVVGTWPNPLAPGQTINVQIQALNTGNQPVGPMFSQQMNVTTPLPRPTGSMAWTDVVAKDSATGTLTGLDAALPAGYTLDYIIVEVDHDGGGYNNFATPPTDTSTFVHSPVTSPGTYTYRARASYNTAAELSDWVQLGILTKFGNNVPFQSPMLTLSVQQSQPDTIFADILIVNTIIAPDGFRLRYAETPGPWQYLDVPLSPAAHSASQAISGLTPHVSHDVQVQPYWLDGTIPKYGSWSLIEQDLPGGATFSGPVNFWVSYQDGQYTNSEAYIYAGWNVNTQTLNAPRAYRITVTDVASTAVHADLTFGGTASDTVIHSLEPNTHYQVRLYALGYSSELLIGGPLDITTSQQNNVQISNDLDHLRNAILGVGGKQAQTNTLLKSIDLKLQQANFWAMNQYIAAIARDGDWALQYDVDSDNDGTLDRDDFAPDDPNENERPVKMRTKEEAKADQESQLQGNQGDLDNWLNTAALPTPTTQGSTFDLELFVPGHGTIYTTVGSTPADWAITNQSGSGYSALAAFDPYRVIVRTISGIGYTFVFIGAILRLIKSY